MKTRAAVAFEAKKPLEIVDWYMGSKIEIDARFALMHAGESIRSVVVF